MTKVYLGGIWNSSSHCEKFAEMLNVDYYYPKSFTH